MKNKILLLLIIFLTSAIFAVNYQYIGKRNQTIEKNDNVNGTVKALTDKKLETINENNHDVSIKTLPKKIQSFEKPNIWADSYILIDRDSFYPLLEKNMYQPVPIASTTKIMTAVLVLESYNLDDVVVVSKNAATQIGSDVFLQTGEHITIRDLLYCLLIKSGNDAAMALAEYETGNVEDFVAKMNKKIEYMGLKNTIFYDPAGLNDLGNSSAFDLAVLTAYAMKNQIFRDIVKTSEITITSVDGINHKLDNSNRLVKSNEALYLPYVLGVKTGFTPDAGHCLVAVAEKNGHILISVILKTYEDTVEASAKESRKLLEWGYKNYEWQ